MPKLSDTFLKILGSSLQGAGGMTPEVQANMALRNRELAIQEHAQALNTLSTLADLHEKFNEQPSNFVGPKNQGSFTPSTGLAGQLGITPGTSYEPLSRTATTPFITPGTTPGSASVQYSSRPLARGEVTEPTINTLGPYGTLLLGQQKNLLDQANSLRGEAKNAMDQVTNLTAKEDPSVTGLLTQSFLSGVLPSNLQGMLRDKSIAGQIQNLYGIYKQKSAQADSIQSQLTTLTGGSPQPKTPAQVPTRPPPPQALANPPTGKIAVWNRQANQYGFIPQANFNPLMYEQIGSPSANANTSIAGMH